MGELPCMCSPCAELSMPACLVLHGSMVSHGSMGGSEQDPEQREPDQQDPGAGQLARRVEWTGVPAARGCVLLRETRGAGEPDSEGALCVCSPS